MLAAPIPLTVIADDLSGAAELAAIWQGARIAIGSSSFDPATHHFIDTGSRDIPVPEAQEELNQAFRKIPANFQIFKKVDSLLRGNTAAELSYIAKTKGGVVLAAANPANGRIILDAHLFVEGQKSHALDLRTLFTSSQLELVPLHQVRSKDLAEIIRDGCQAGKIVVADSRTTEDLKAIARAVSSVKNPPMMAGSAGLFQAIFAGFSAKYSPVDVQPLQESAALAPPESPLKTTGALCVVGSIDPVVESQLAEALTQRKAVRIDLDFDGGLLPEVDRVRSLLNNGKIVFVQVAQHEHITPAVQNQIAQNFGNWVAHIEQTGPFPTAIIGGSTAHASLKAMGVGSIEVMGSLEPGTAISRLPNGQVLITRPGSYGDRYNLQRISEFFLQPRAGSSSHSS